MLKIMVLNAKGGCGKTTIATNLAACYASRGFYPALWDYDAQGTSSKWLDIRPEHVPPIHGIVAHKQKMTVTRSWQMRMPSKVDRVIIDTPAAVENQDLANHVKQANVIIIPVLPSPIDIHATTDFIKELLVIGKMRLSVKSSDDPRIAVVANRVSDNTLIYQPLLSFLEGVNLPMIASLSDSHYYVHAFLEGVGIHELRDSRTQLLKKQWQPLLTWIDNPDIAADENQSSADPRAIK
ncbi:MAG TPA: ParA family protein [Methylotenera sp.]|nr:ParA family protein [Methylotenera sp.]